MIIDTRLEFCEATALNTGGAGTYLIGNVIDLGSDPGAAFVGNSDDLYLFMFVQTTATSGDAATGQFTLASDAQAAIATDGSASGHFATGAIPKATLVAGYQVCAVELPRGTYERYLGILQTTGTAAFTAGKVSAFLTNDPMAHKIFAAGI